MVERLKNYLGTEVDNSPLILFRVCFGFLLAVEAFGAIGTGWVHANLIDPEITFPFIMVSWLKPLPGQWMLVYYGLMGLAGVGIMLGYRYRISAISYFVMWLGVYLMQKTSYNNHYYLMVLLTGIMSLLPAHHAYSLDVKAGRVVYSDKCYRVFNVGFAAQIVLVYWVAGLVKIYPDWLQAKPIAIWFNGKTDYPVIGALLGQTWFHYFISYAGIVYDLIIPFVLINNRTRKLGFYLSVAFNLFNSAVFQIGVFPYMMISLSVFFYRGEQIRKAFFRGKPIVKPSAGFISTPVYWMVVAFFIWQLYLPIRHFHYPGPVTWTEEGHRMAWRMMLKVKGGHAIFNVIDKSTGEEWKEMPVKHCTRKQAIKVATHPDMTWQYAQFLKQHYADQGRDVAIFVDGKVSLNKSKYHQLIDPNVDLASVDWNHFSHNKWILYPND
ncbi:MAG: HTTM domain-containing protein [Cyclobacteriaceae bacterium]